MIYLLRGKSKHKSKNFLESICTCIVCWVCMCECAHVHCIYIPPEGWDNGRFLFSFLCLFGLSKVGNINFFFIFAVRERKKCSKTQSTFRYYNGAGKINGLT